MNGISIDKTGKLTVDANVPHGTTATILADVEKGRKKLSGKVYVFHPDENPWIGQWHVDTDWAMARGHACDMWRLTGDQSRSTKPA
jgi:hypothetical protein